MGFLNIILTFISDSLSVILFGAGGATIGDRILSLMQYFLALNFFL